MKKSVKKPAKKAVKKIIKKKVVKAVPKKIVPKKAVPKKAKDPVFKISQVGSDVIVTEEIKGKDIVVKKVSLPVQPEYPIEIGTHPISGKRHMKRVDGTTYYE